MIPELPRPPRSPAPPPVTTQSGERGLGAAPMLAPGKLLASKYRIKAVLGRGGFATVYEAEQLAFARDVALKVLHRTDGTPHVLIERFAREVRISALVRHPNVLEVYDAGVLDDGSPFLAMEKIAGPTLRAQLDEVRRLPIEQVLELAAQLLAALVAIGAQGIIHRDIKPENMMLARGSDGAVQLKLVDFGIALVREERIASRLTAHGALIGTPQYMAPEQLRSEITDVRVDLYAAGVVLYQALTGELPHDAPDLSSLTLHVLEGKWRPLRALRPDCPRSLAKVVERALAPDPVCRYASAADMLLDLEVCRRELRGARSGVRRAPESRVRWDRFLPQSPFARAGVLLLALMAAGAVQAGAAAAFRRGLGAMFEGESTVPGPAHAAALGGARASRAPRASNAPPVDGAAAARAPELAAQPVEAVGSRPERTEPPALGAGPATEEPAESRPAPAAASTSPGQLERARALTRRGLSLYLHGDVDAAYAAYRKASQLAPEDPAAFRALGLLASQLGRTQEARRAFTRYLELSPAAPDGAMIRGRMKAGGDEGELVRSDGGRVAAPVSAHGVL